MFCPGIGWFTCISVVALIATAYSDPYSIAEWYPVMKQTDVKESTLWLNGGIQRKPEFFPAMTHSYGQDTILPPNWGFQHQPEFAPAMPLRYPQKATPLSNWGFQRKPDVGPLLQYLDVNKAAAALNWGSQPRPDVDLWKLYRDINVVTPGLNRGFLYKPGLEPVVPPSDAVRPQPKSEPLMPDAVEKEDAPQLNRSSELTPEPVMPHSNLKDDAQQSNHSSQLIPELPGVPGRPAEEAPACCTCDHQCTPGTAAEWTTGRPPPSQPVKGRCGCCRDCPRAGATKSRGAAAASEALTNAWKANREMGQVFYGAPPPSPD